MNVSEMKPKQIKEAREELLRRLNEYAKSFRVRRVTSLTQATVMLEGGKFPATYDHETRILTIWGRGSRYAGADATIQELHAVENTCQFFFDEYMGRTTNYEELRGN